MKIVLDSNVIFGDYLLNGAQVGALRRYLTWTDAELLVPQVVVEEAIRHFRRAYQGASQSLVTASDVLSIVDHSLAPIPSAEEAVSAYREKLEARLRDLGARILPIPSLDLEVILSRDLQEKRPFNRSGKRVQRYVDLAECCRRLLSARREGSDGIADGDFQLNPKDRDRPAQLHDDLREDLSRHGLGEQRVEIRRALHEFDEEFVWPLVERVYRRGERIEGTFAESLQPMEMLHRYWKAAARDMRRDLRSVLPVGRAWLDGISLASWPEDAMLLEALDLGDGTVQAVVRARIVFDTRLHAKEEDYRRLVDFAASESIPILGTEWDEPMQEFVLQLRVSLLADFVFLWDMQTNAAAGIDLLQLGFTPSHTE